MNNSLTRRMIDGAEVFLKSNSRMILTSSAVTGVVMTSYLTATATFRAAKQLQEAEPKPETRAEKVKLVWSNYVPAALAGGGTIATIIFSHRSATRKIAALAAAYALTEKALDEYKDKLAEVVNKKTLDEIKSKIAEDKIAENPPDESRSGSQQALVFTSDKVLCCELYTMRYFYSDLETIRRAENTVNAILVTEPYVFMTELYHTLGLEETTFSQEFGWESEKPLKIHYSTTMTPDNRPCIAFEYNYVRQINTSRYT